MNVYRVRDWSRHFEHGEMRKVHRMAWVKLPTKQEGDGYRTLIDHPQGWAHFGVWNAILQLAAKCEVRGALVRDLGAAGVQPHDAASVGRIIGAPSALVDEALPRLVAIGWLEVVPLETVRPSAPSENPPKSSDDRQGKAVLEGQGQGQSQGEEEARARADDEPAASALPDGITLSESEAAQLRVVESLGGSLWLAARGGRGARRPLHREWLAELHGYAQDRIVGTFGAERPRLPSEFRRAVAPHRGERIDAAAAARDAEARDQRRRDAATAREEREATDRRARSIADAEAANVPKAEALMAAAQREPFAANSGDLTTWIGHLRKGIERGRVGVLVLNRVQTLIDENRVAFARQQAGDLAERRDAEITA